MIKLKLALIGYGDWAQKIEKYLLINSKFQIIKIYTSKVGRDIFTNDMNEIADNESIEAVIIASPPETHFHLSRFFLIKNKSVFCEKPLAHNMTQVRELDLLHRESQLKIFTDYTFLYSSDLIDKVNIIKLLKGSKINVNIKMNFSQNGKFYIEHVYFTLTSHLLAILDEIIDIEKTKFVVENEVLKDGFVVSTKIEFEYLNFSGNIETSLISQSKIRIIEFSFDDTKIKYEPLSFDNLKSKDENQNLSRVLNDFHNIVKNNLNDNFDKSFRITNVLTKIIDSIKR